LLGGEESLPFLPEYPEQIDGELIQQALVALKVSTRLGRTFPLGMLVSDLCAKSDHHPDYVRRQVMWLMKYGFVSVEGGFQGLDGREN
jgi:hypothetical protein